ncbi:tetratricopeptide repeat protein [Methylobacterium sp. A54F]
MTSAGEGESRGIARGAGIRIARGAAVAALLLAAAGCQSRSPETTGSIGGPSGAGLSGAGSDARVISRREVEALGAKYAADSGDLGTAMRYAQGLRATDQRAQAVAVLQQAALRNPKNPAVTSAYGKALVEVGRYQEAAEVLQNAHSPAQPDWRVLSAQGAAADQLGDHARAQGFYEAALKIRPNEPAVLSNLGLSYILARQLDRAEQTLRLAASQPGADARVRQNLALALGLKGRFPEAEEQLRRDLGPAEAAANLTSLRGLVAQQNSWKAIQAADKAARKPAPPRG